MPYNCPRAFLVLVLLLSICACSSWQPTKNVWKSTKGLWNTYVSPPAHVDYDDKGSLSKEAVALSRAIVGIDSELNKLERTMMNADRPPTQEWLSRLFSDFPWLNGFAGVKYDGTILGQEPPDSIKQLDFIPLLYEDSKQHSRALRADVQPGPLGPEIMLAAPLYDGVDFLGIVVAYFDMRSLMHFSQSASDIVALTPRALLWPGKYEYASTPLSGVEWEKVVRESTAGTCSNNIGSFYYVIHYLGNLPIVFAIPEKGNFPEGNGGLEQAANYFPQEREKLPPPPIPERQNKPDSRLPAFEKPEEPEPPAPAPAGTPAPPLPEASDRHVIPQGSRESMLLKRGRAKPARRIEERLLDGETVAPTRRAEPPVGLLPDSEPQQRRPSPFGPAKEEVQEKPYQRPSPFGPARQEETPAAQPESETPAVTPSQPAPEAAPQPAPEAPKETSQPAPETPAPEAPKAAAQPEPETPEPSGPNEIRAPAQSGEAASAPQDNAKEPARPATLPGGRPSPFGPGR